MSDPRDEFTAEDVLMLRRAAMDYRTTAVDCDTDAHAEQVHADADAMSALADRLEARLAAASLPAPYPCLDTPEPD